MRLALWLACCAIGCGSAPAPAPAANGPLPADRPARVGSQSISAATVTRIAESQRISALDAARLAVSDALLAEGARSLLPNATCVALERSAAARALLEQFQRDAVAAGPPTPAELNDVVQTRWLELDRPDAVRTTHAIVIAQKPEQDALAKALAEKLRAAVLPATSGDELIRIAKAFPSEGGLKIQAEALPFVSADGRVFQRRDAGFVALAPFDADFARGAAQLHDVGQLSPPVKSAFGYHVIRLEERLSGARAAPEQLATLLGPEVLLRRASKARRDLLERLKLTSPIQVDRAADDLTARLSAQE